MKKVPATKVATASELAESPLPPQVQEALGELVGAAREGLLALSVGVGLGVVHELMAAEVDEVVGPKGRHDTERAAVRHGHEHGAMTLGARRVSVRRPRVRSADAEREVPLATYEHFAERDPLTRAVMDRMLAGVSTRRFASVGEPVGAEVASEESSTSRSAVSRAFVERTRTALGELMSRRLEDVRLAAMMIDGLEIAGRCHVVALGITTEGVKLPLGLWEGSTENATLARSLLSDLVDRGLDPEQGILFVIDGSKALRKAITEVFGSRAPVQRCQRHKERNVTDQLPERDRAAIRGRLRAAWALAELELARSRLDLLACELDRSWPDAARSLREGPRGDADLDAAGDLRAPREDARLDQRLRVDDRDRSLYPAKREVLAVGRHAPALERRRDARGRATVPADHRLSRPRQARPRGRARGRPRARDHRLPGLGAGGRRYTRLR